jgi:hypothetical protein
MNQPMETTGNDDDVRSRPHNGLKSDIAPLPKGAQTRTSIRLLLDDFVGASEQ